MNPPILSGSPDPSWCWNHLQHARWYGGRGRVARLSGLTTLPWWSEPKSDQPGVRSVIAEVQYVGGAELYHLLLAAGPGNAPLRDAADDDQAMLLLWHGLRRLSRRGGDGLLQAKVAPRLPVAPRPEVISGEQSNTTIRYGTAAVLKVFRRLIVGGHPDLEVHRAAVPGTAGLLGSASASWLPPTAGPHDAVHTLDLAMLVQQVPDAEDGWTLALAAARDGESYATEAMQIGAALRQVHHGLATAFGTGVVDGSSLGVQLRAEVTARAESLPPLGPYLPGLERIISGLAGHRLAVQRIHGDCHLGQILRGSDGRWIVIDFEGEPLKPRVERIKPDSPLRDLAGLLRSFSYVRATVERAGRPLAEWESAAVNALLSGYLGEPVTRESFALEGHPPAALDAYEADRASYEVSYEAGHRPDWIDIPLRAVARLTGETEPEDRP